MNLYESGLTIGALARRTGVSTSTLRAWERRYGFPVPQRLESGHRRYTERDVSALRSALRDRQGGSSMAHAFERAKAMSLGPRGSMFGALRHALPEAAPASLSKRSMRMLSRAIEDEIAATAESPILVAAFQRQEFWRASEGRWHNLATDATAAVVFATMPRRRRQERLWQIPIDQATAIAREWVVLCDSPTFAVCLAGVELPGDTGARRFEAVWTTEPLVVREVLRVAGDIASGHDPHLDATLRPVVESPAITRYDSVRATTRLTNRIVAYLDRPG